MGKSHRDVEIPCSPYHSILSCRRSRTALSKEKGHVIPALLCHLVEDMHASALTCRVTSGKLARRRTGLMLSLFVQKEVVADASRGTFAARYGSGRMFLCCVSSAQMPWSMAIEHKGQRLVLFSACCTYVSCTTTERVQLGTCHIMCSIGVM